MPRTKICLISRRILTATKPTRSNASYIRGFASGLPETIKRVGTPEAFPNEYPGQNYGFNWALNADGVTPINRSAWRITKPLDLKIAGLNQPKARPLQVKVAASDNMPEAGSDALSFDKFDEILQSTKDCLSQSDHIYCPEGHAPSTHTTVRVITNSSALAVDLHAYLERAPRRDPPGNKAITAYLFEGADEDFLGYAIEEVEEEDKATGEVLELKSVAAICVTGKKINIKNVVAGIESSVEGLKADAIERAAAKEAEENI